MNDFRCRSEHVHDNKAHRLGLVALVLFIYAMLNSGCATIVAHAQSDRTTYLPQRGTPAAIPNFIDSEAGCNWSGVGGQVFDVSGTPVTGLVVKVDGMVDNQSIIRFVLSGSSLQFGPGGYEILLADHLVTLEAPLHMQLLDLSGREKSPVIEFQVFADCQRNLQVINLAEWVVGWEIYFPLIIRY